MPVRMMILLNEDFFLTKKLSSRLFFFLRSIYFVRKKAKCKGGTGFVLFSSLQIDCQNSEMIYSFTCVLETALGSSNHAALSVAFICCC